VGINDAVSAAEIVGGACLFLMFVYRQVKTGARDAWREEAEAQTARADRLEKELSRLTEVVESLRRENRELREHIDRLLNRGTDDTAR
jgi:predicted RNase H-like nuclease (RuvC/YqgF family)